ncbi:MAG: tetratricopeptide repeat protein [Promethearchaeota archaeon]
MISDSLREEIEQGWRLLNERKEEEALQLIIEFEKKDDLTPEERLRCQILKGTLLFLVGRFDEAVKIGEKTIQESLNLNKALLAIDAILFKFGALVYFDKPSRLGEMVRHAKQLLEPFLKNFTPDVEKGELIFLFIGGWWNMIIGRNDLALQHIEKCLEMVKKHVKFLFLEPFILGFMGGIYVDKGGLREALKVQERVLELSLGDSYTTKANKSGSLMSIGSIHYQKGNLDLAIEYYEKSLKIMEEIKFMILIGIVYDRLIEATLDKGTPKLANEYLMRFQQFNEKNEGLLSAVFFDLSRARILKSSTRTRNRAEAEQILKKISEEPSTNFLPIFITPVLITLCDLYLQELKTTNDLEIIEDIQPLISRLLKESERTNSFSLRSQALFLNGKISMLQLNMGDARRYLTDAQQIADSHGLQLLAREISHEHDKLLEQLDRLGGSKKTEMTPSERMNLASFDDTMNLMQGKREINAPKLVNEEPILLLILTNGGVLIFSHSFDDEWIFDSELFGGFLSAFNTISDEVFSEGLDRVKFGHHTVLIESVADFSVCYLYKGQTYLAKQKLANFSSLVQEDASIEQILEKFEKTSQVLQIKDFPFLKPLITQIFIKN